MTADWVHDEVKKLNEKSRNEAIDRQGQLTKPPGSLGRLESLAIQLAGMQGVSRPAIEKVQISIFAGDHGVAGEEGVSAFPQAVTTEMVKNFSRGGAAICVLAKENGAKLEVINMGTIVDPGLLDGVLDRRVSTSTNNFAKDAAMTEGQVNQSLDAGREAVERAETDNADMFIGGEMGIGNTTSASALACALTSWTPGEMAGPGTGLDKSGISHKSKVIKRALDLHKDNLNDPMEVLRLLGGFEIAALVGAYIACAQKGIPAVVDGFITTAAALVATRINKDVANWLIYSHSSAEPGHLHILKELNAKPLIELGMRLGEGSGAALSIALIKQAVALHNGMATFGEAEVSEKNE